MATAVDQKSDGFSMTVAKAVYPNNAVGDTRANQGVVTIAPLVNGRPGDIAGFTRVRHGTSTDVKVPVQVQLRSGTYRVALYPGGKFPADTQQALTGTNVTITVALELTRSAGAGGDCSPSLVFVAHLDLRCAA